MSTLSEPDIRAPQDTIPLCVPEMRGNEWRYVRECLDTNFVSSVGPFVDRFERMMADYVGTRHAVATVNGTAALHTALLVAGIRPDDEILVSDLTFIAPANAIRYVGAWPVFIDSEPHYWQMDPRQVSAFIENECQWHDGTLRNQGTGRRVRGIMPVHILGHPVDMDPILETARKYNLVVIEDATESLGARYKERKVGTMGHLACFSFNGNKIITTGGGGMIVTDNEAWAKKARYLTTQAKDDPLEFVHGEIGYNHRLTNVLAALGCAQMEVLDEYIAVKRRIAATYANELGHVSGLTLMKTAPWASSISWLYTILVDPDRFGLTSRDLLRRLADAGIQSRPLWQPMHLSPAHRENPARCCDVAAMLNRNAISLPCSVGLSETAQARVIEVVRKAQKPGASCP